MFESWTRAPRLPCVTATLATLAAVACESSSAGVAPSVDDLPDLRVTEEVRVGSRDDPVAGFSRISAVRVADDGDVYVLEGSAREVRVFSEDGEPLRIVGGAGEGPGEFQFPTSIGLLGDTLWVTDAMSGRLTWFGPDGEVLFETPARGVAYESGVRGLGLTLVPSRPRSDGLIESGLTTFVTGDREIRSYRYPVLLFDRGGQVVDTLRWETAEETAPTYRRDGGQRYAPYLRPLRPVEEAFPDGRAVVDWWVDEGGARGTLDILRTGETGDTLYHRVVRYDPIPVPSQVPDSPIEPRLANARARNDAPAELERTLREAIELPDFRAPIRSARVGQDGTLWVELNTPSPEAAEWVVVDEDGSILGKVALPVGTRIQHTALPTVWAVELDELEIPWLVRLRVE